MRTSHLLIVALLVGCASAAFAQQEPPRFSLSIEADHDKYEVGQPILLKVTITNMTTREISVPFREAYAYLIVAADENGKAIAKLPPKGVEVGSGTRITLKPKESLAEDLNAGKRLDFSSPGKYFVRVLYGLLAGAGGKPVAEVASNVVSISVAAGPQK
jgi:hypothetical protein